ALEGVAVQVGQARHRDAGAPLGAARRRVAAHRLDATVGDRERDVARPAVGQQRIGEIELGHSLTLADVLFVGPNLPAAKGQASAWPPPPARAAACSTCRAPTRARSTRRAAWPPTP